MSQPITISLQLDLSDCGAFVTHLLRALGTPGVTEARLCDFLTVAVTGECAVCGSRLTPQDLLALVEANVKGGEANSHISRLRRGYCAQNGCSSGHYRFSFSEYPGVEWPAVLATVESAVERQREQTLANAEPEHATKRTELSFDGHPGVDWSAILAAMESAAERESQEAISEAGAHQAAQRAERRKLALKVVAGVVLALLLLLLRQWITGGRMPFTREPEGFPVNPASLREPPPE